MKYNMDKDLEYYICNQSRLVKEYNGKYIIIKNEKVDSTTFDTIEEAIEYAEKKYGLGQCLIHLVGPNEENYTAILSRVKEYA